MNPAAAVTTLADMAARAVVVHRVSGTHVEVVGDAAEIHALAGLVAVGSVVALDPETSTWGGSPVPKGGEVWERALLVLQPQEVAHLVDRLLAGTIPGARLLRAVEPVLAAA